MDTGVRPGLAKTRGERLVRLHRVTLLRASDGALREMFEAADVVTEGSQAETFGTATWFGSTSLVLPWPPGMTDESARAYVCAVARRDPHVRLRALRVAHREASLRAPGNLGRAECEIRVVVGSGGLRIDVDIQAPLTLASRAGGTEPVV